MKHNFITYNILGESIQIDIPNQGILFYEINKSRRNC